MYHKIQIKFDYGEIDILFMNYGPFSLIASFKIWNAGVNL